MTCDFPYRWNLKPLKTGSMTISICILWSCCAYDMLRENEDACKNTHLSQLTIIQLMEIQCHCASSPDTGKGGTLTRSKPMCHRAYLEKTRAPELWM
jgi:hypothetical protein